MYGMQRMKDDADDRLQNCISAVSPFYDMVVLSTSPFLLLVCQQHLTFIYMPQTAWIWYGIRILAINFNQLVLPLVFISTSDLYHVVML